MKKKINSLGLSLLVLAIGSIGGTTLTWKLAGQQSSDTYFYFAIIVSSTIFSFQCVAYRLAQSGLYFELFYTGSIFFSITWFILSIFLPILWMNSIEIHVRAIVLIIFIFISLANISLGYRLISKELERKAVIEFDRIYNEADKSVNWEKIVCFMNISLEILVPGIPQSCSPLLGVFMVASMFLGLNLRNVFPHFSIFAWGIPSAVAAAFFLQMSSFIFSQARMVKRVQQSRAITIKSAE